MILTIDVGNTETTLGIFRGLEPEACWRIHTDRHRTGDEHALILRALLQTTPRDRRPRRAVLASVVPVLDREWQHACDALDLSAHFVDGETELPIRLEVDTPAEVGADRIANTLAAREIYHRDTVVVDLGTATTFDCITADGDFLGGVIAPGPRAGMERLTEAASKLSPIEIRPPDRVIGRHTAECVDAGVFYAAVDAIDGIVTRILEEWRHEDALVVATGGMAGMLAPHCRTVERIEPFLTLTGLAVADRYLQASG